MEKGKYISWDTEGGQGDIGIWKVGSNFGHDRKEGRYRDDWDNWDIEGRK